MSGSAIAEQDQYRSVRLEGLKLMAVQPACLQAHPILRIQQQQNHRQRFQYEGVAVQLEQHELLLQLDAMLTAEQPSAPADSATVAETVDVKQRSTMLPLPLQHATLDLIVLSRQMQLLQHQQVSLLKLLQQHTIVGDAAGPANSIGNSSSSSRSSWSALLNLHTSIACPPSDRLLNCLHLVLVLSNGAQQQQEHASSSSSAAQAWSVVKAAAPAGVVIADVPLLLLPAAAQQEVQQLLLPAMRQEVQAEQQQQRVPLLSLQESAHQCQRACLAVEHAAWKHFSHLSQDVHTVMQLSSAAESAAAAAQRSASVAAQIPVCERLSTNAIAGAGDAPAARPAAEAANDDAAMSCAVVMQHGSSTTDAAATALAPADALAHLAETLLFPLLLPFLAAQGMHNMLHLLLLHLPVGLQQQWQQQQLERLQELSNASPPFKLPVFEEATAAQQSMHASHDEAQQQQQQPDDSWLGSPTLDDHFSVSKDAQPQMRAAEVCASTSTSKQQRQQQDKVQRTEPAAAAAMHAAASACSGIVTVPGDVAWHLPLTQFADATTESSYLAWKHHSLLHLDCVAALFGLFYLAVLLRRLLSEPTTLFYFCVILTKVLPHMPLLLGWRQTFLRHRETWLLLVAPTMALIAMLLSLPSVMYGQPALLLPNRAYRAYWHSRGELQTTVMRPFTQHMRLIPYILYSVLDALISVWVFGQVFGMWAAIIRWSMATTLSVGLSWGLDLYMRCQFVKAVCRQGQQQQQPDMIQRHACQ